MLLAESVFRKALDVRDKQLRQAKKTEIPGEHAEPSGQFKDLESVVRSWTRKRFESEDSRIAVLKAVLETNETMRTELAEALNWDQPKQSSAELVLSAVSAVRRGEDGNFPAILSQNLDWQKWKTTHDLGELQTLLEWNSEVRNKLAKEVNGYPGLRDLGELAARVAKLLPIFAEGGAVPADEEAKFKVLKDHLLNWDAFTAEWPGPMPANAQTDLKAKERWERKLQQGSPQELDLKAILQADYEFRHDVALAVRQPNGEAVELANLAVEMWRAIPSHGWIGRNRSKLLKDEKHKNRIPAQLQSTAEKDSDEDGWESVTDNLALDFARNPRLAVELWDAMGWPYPFSLVLREELNQIQARRGLFSQDANCESRANSNPLPEGAAQSTVGNDGNPPRDPCRPPQISEATEAPDVSDLAVRMKLFGVAFSGGGIRSATFNLGVLQKLSNFGLLGKVDYLSTVSGGGYIGSWLTGWMRKNRATDPPKFLDELRSLLSPTIPDPRAEPQRPVRFLREFSNYLTPRLGSFSFDTWTMASVYSRNLFLNQATLIAVLGCLLLTPRYMILPLTWCGTDWWMWAAALLLVATGVYCMSVNLSTAVDPDEKALNKLIVSINSTKFITWINRFIRDHVQVSVIVPILAATYLGSLWIWRNESTLKCEERYVAGWAFGIALVLSFLLLWLGGFMREFERRQVGSQWMPAVLVLILVLSAGAMTGLLLVDLAVMNKLKQLGEAGIWNAVIWSPVMLLAVLVMPGTLQVGLMGVDFPDAGREWLSRFRAIVTVYSICWIAFTGAAIYGPWLILTGYHGAKHWVSGVTAGWIVTTVGGILAGNSKKTGTDKEGVPKLSWLQLLARIAPPIFAAGLLLLIATGEQVLLAHGEGVALNSQELQKACWKIPDWSQLFDFKPWFVDQPGWLFLVLLAAGTIFAWRVDINEFSMHHFYKNRLVRCYLGASNEKRRPNEFTGFDARDDLRLARLKTIPDEEERTDKKPKEAHANKNGEVDKRSDTHYLGPYPIVNTTLNLSAGEQLAWQERKGASFILSPCFCGFDVQGWASATAKKKRPSGTLARSEELLPAGYRKTSGFTHKDGPFLGTSFAISGAAASPNQGYNTSPAVAFLMTMFDVRLGWWLGNPRRKTSWMKSSPTFGLLALFSELMGMTDDKAAFVNLSDGGHFDNMGLYELVRRRCNLILLCDAEQDPEFKFAGLGSAIRKCRIDFGAFIEIDTSLIRPGKDAKPSGTHCAVGKIRYLDGSQGTLVYIKPSLTGDEPEDVTQYHRARADFPHETTADQWFAESQFESYRALGYHAADHSLKYAGAWIDWNPDQPDITKLAGALKKYWYPDNPNLKDSASRNTATLVKMLDKIRETEELRDLGSRLFPGITVPPPTDVAATQEFYFGLSILQLVEDIYFDFKLDRDEWLNDPRIEGWKHLFETWKRVPEVAAAWASARETFRQDFQHFWETRIN